MKTRKIPRALIAALLAAAFLAAGCEQPAAPPQEAAPIDAFVPVTDITGVPTGGVKGAAIDLSGAKAAPDNATNKAVAWSIKDPGPTSLDRGLAGKTFTPDKAGDITLTASVTNGKAGGLDFTKDFTLTITDVLIPVEAVTGVPLTGQAGTPADLSAAVVTPGNATNKTIHWSVDKDSPVQGTISGNTVNPSAAGSLKLTATILQGKADGSPYAQSFTLTISPKDAPKPPANMTGIAIESPPDITVYGRGQPFSAEGLKVKGLYNDETERLLEGSEYLLSPPSIDTAVPGPKMITVTAGTHTAQFAVMVNVSDKTLQSIALTRLPNKTRYEFGAATLNLDGMEVTGSYSDGSTKIEPVYAYSGYDRTKRGTQTISVIINRHTAAFDVTVKIPASAAMSVNKYVRGGGGARLEDAYNPAYLKGRASPVPERLRVTVVANNVTGVFTAEAGDFSAADFSGYDPNQTGNQTLILTLDSKQFAVPIYVMDVDPQLFFDYGYWRHAGNPNGGSPAGGDPQYTVPLGQTLVITPVVFFLNTAAPVYIWSVSGGAPYTTSGAGNKYLHITPASEGAYTAAVTVSAGGVTKTASTAIVCAPQRPGAHPPEATHPSFTSPIPNIVTSGNLVTTACIKNFAPGQFTRSGTGYGWSLGAFGGYQVWKLRKENDGTENIRIGGNAFVGWEEPGVIWASIDDNHNGLPDDTWYELKGSDDESAVYRSQISRSHGITYIRDGDASVVNEYGQTIDAVYWADSKGRAGVQPGGWPAVWGVQGGWVTFSGTLLREAQMPFTYPHNLTGYVDALDDRYSIAHAVKPDGSPANLPWIDFVKVHTGVQAYGSTFGETSTEIGSADGLGTQTDFPDP
ncbi:MAG: bacterial Ig-like domain-containing protein [Treponema sp.]|jgi:hypothetical protein|nr:bacterial Ig-like domain-containing protein [Treponema sp.]